MSKELDNNSGIPQCKITSHSPSAPTNNRWWENYLVRYLVPSIVGMFILIILNKMTDNSIQNILTSFYSNKGDTKLTNSILIVWFLLGTGFCYVASYPILALHVVARFSYEGKEENEEKAKEAKEEEVRSFGAMLILISAPIISSISIFILNFIFIYFTHTDINFKFYIPTIIIPLTSLLILSIVFLYLKTKNTERLPFLHNNINDLIIPTSAVLATLLLLCISPYPKNLSIWIISSSVAFILSLVITILYKVVNDKILMNFSSYYYANLERRYSTKESKEVVDSYKHLREHGNTALIIILEIILAICLYLPLKFIHLQKNELESLIIITITIIGLILWILPACLIYFFGHAIESQHVKNSK